MNVPKLRFKEFDGEWEEKDIIHIAQDEKSAVKIGPFGSQLRKEYLQSAGLYKVYGQENVFNNDFSQGNRFLNEERFNLLKSSEIISGDIVISMMGTIGKIAEVPSNIQVGIMDSHLIRIRLDNQKYLNSFFIQVMNSTILKKQIEKLSVGSIMSGLSSKVIKTLQFPYTKIEEQKKISKFLNLLDKKIQLQQQKIDLLQEQKKGFLQKLLPEINELIPKKRFEGFKDSWSICKIKEICKISTGKGNTQDKVEGGIYPFYVRSATIERSNDFLYDQEAVLTIGDGVGTGKVFHYVNGKYNLHQRVYRMYNFENTVLAKYFYYYFSENFYRRVMAMTAKTSVDSVRMDMIAEMDIKYPSLLEQKRIIEFFNKLDNNIKLHEKKLEILQQQKQGFMQQMFI